jgi:hypothetical protein
VTLNIGATLAVPGETVSSVIARADAAMYQAKSGDRNTVVLAEPTQPSTTTTRYSVPGVARHYCDVHDPAS